LHNPRNSFPPTAQDLHETCNGVLSRWRHRVINYYCGGKAWIDCDDLAYILSKRGYMRGPAPSEHGCFIPPELILDFLREYLSSVAVQDALVTISERVFNNIPDAAFPQGVRDAILAKRLDRQKAEAERIAEEARLEAL